MTAENLPIDPYDAVLADLRAKRDQIDQTIQLLEAMRGGTSLTPPASVSAPAVTDSAEGPGAYLGMTIPDATRKLLAARKRTLGNAEIHVGLTTGGLAMNSADPVNTIGSVLTRRFHQVGDIVRVSRGMWGLKEWYPNRNFKVPSKSGETKTEPSAPAQPSEQPDDVPQETSDRPVQDHLSVHQGGRV